jgi:RimJ/RimL family protein N-acetyltransferase
VATVGRGEEEKIIGVGRYVVPKTEPDPPRTAEVAFIVLDEHQGRGIGSKLFADLIIIAREKGLREFSADVLPDNHAMLRVFEKSGLHARRKVESCIFPSPRKRRSCFSSFSQIRARLSYTSRLSSR